MWLNAILNLVGLGKEVIGARVNLKVAEIEARAKRFAMVANNEATWEQMAAQNSANSWLDEWWTIVLSFPLIACFVPALVPFVAQGFEALATVPQWYVWAVLASVSFAFARHKMPDLTAWRSKAPPKER